MTGKAKPEAGSSKPKAPSDGRFETETANSEHAPGPGKTPPAPKPKPAAGKGEKGGAHRGV